VIKNKKGFTLAELMLAAFIIAFVLSGLLLLFTNCMLLNSASRNLSVATSHAEYVMESIRATSFTGLETRIVNGGSTGWDLTTTALAQAPYSFSTLPDENITTGVFQSGNPLGVLVTVNWNDRGPKARSTELTTYITDY
jgi:prepilin-type N-terminal cleavage/methylation domain-containing protein